MPEQVEYVALRDCYVAGRYITAGDIAELDAEVGDVNRHLERVEPLPRGEKSAARPKKSEA
jgi:hypothetical protein